MTKQQRRDRLLPNGIPRWIRCYDNGGLDAGGSIDRYTVVFTGNFAERNLVCYYLGMDENPYHPQGFGQHGDCVHHIIDRPTYSHLGKPIKFKDLPEMCKLFVLNDYKQIWGLE